MRFAWATKFNHAVDGLVAVFHTSLFFCLYSYPEVVSQVLTWKYEISTWRQSNYCNSLDQLSLFLSFFNEFLVIKKLHVRWVKITNERNGIDERRVAGQFFFYSLYSFGGVSMRGLKAISWLLLALSLLIRYSLCSSDKDWKVLLTQRVGSFRQYGCDEVTSILDHRETRKSLKVESWKTSLNLSSSIQTLK